MKSPFPGMDPYLEQHWRDVHAGLVIYARDQLQPELPDTLRARVEERVYVESEIHLERSVSPDVRVVERKRKTAGRGAVQTGSAIAEPVLISVDDEPVSEGYVEIIDVASDNRVTIIEFLSPSNKIPGDGQDLYLRKQREVRLSETSLVEVDLNPPGSAGPALAPRANPSAASDDLPGACVRRGYRRSPVEIYDLPLHRRLPAIGIPLREGENDVALDLQALVESAYRNGAYDDIDYRVDPVPPLKRTDAAWADRLLRSKGLRPKKGGKRPR
jgi:hypothetical protein